MIIGLMVCFVILITIFIGYQVYTWKHCLSSMGGMMIAMTMAMMVSLTVGMTIALKVISDPTIATIYTIVLGIFIGYIIGYPFGILAQLDGILAGIMGGLMGPMTGLMVSNSKPHLFIGFFTLLFAFITLLVFQFIHRSIPSSHVKTTKYSWYLFLPTCAFLASLAIFQSSLESPLHANTLSSSVQKKGYQEAVIQVRSNGYFPSSISLKAGIPTKLNFKKISNTGCLSYLIIQDLRINQELKEGDNIISFTPEKTGIITFTCGMGMYKGALKVN
ncbi:cupredoxin domain-containing protein [Shimazuella kribbensis]|uniref:cupredoxin domain-containing protein n=1 Tax=Shimazuella kribbensis TaxID=139808 RepID=UPI00040516A8|nr:cupredoxin domain-containing protein [Shimazuella kribbensis]